MHPSMTNYKVVYEYLVFCENNDYLDILSGSINTQKLNPWFKLGTAKVNLGVKLSGCIPSHLLSVCEMNEHKNSQANQVWSA